MTDAEQKVFQICRAAMSPELVKKQVHENNQRIAKHNKKSKQKHQFIDLKIALETYGEFDMQIVMKWAALKGIDPVQFAEQWALLKDDEKMKIFTVVSADEAVMK